MSIHDTYCSCVLCFLKEVVPITIIVFTALFILFIGINTLDNHISFPMQIQKVEQVRKDLVTAPIGERSELINRAVSWNQSIVSCRYWNSRWWADLMYPDGCNDLLLINVSE